MTNRPVAPPPSQTGPSRPSGTGSRKGIILFIVMILIVMMSLAGLSFVLMMSTENMAVHLHGDELQIEQVAASGEELLKAFCGLSLDERRQALGSFDNPDLLRGVLVVDDEQRGRRARFSVVSPQIEDDRIVSVRFGPGNESARINLAVLPQWDIEHPGAARDALLNLPGMTEPIADALLDWIDVDPTPRPSGAEVAYYSGLGVPYGPRNGVPTSLEELLLIRDVSRELLFGADLDRNYDIDQNEQQLASTGSGVGPVQGGLPWESLLTVYSAERNVDFQGRPRIHLNQRDLAKLHQQLSDAFEPSWANFIASYRQFGPHEEGEQPRPRARARRSPRTQGAARLRTFGRDRSPESAESAWGELDIDFSKPPKFKINSVLDLLGVQVQLPSPETPPSDLQSGPPDDDAASPDEDRPLPILESPFPLDRPAMQDYLPKLADGTTVVADKVLRGRVNVNEAPRAVLSAVPGLDTSLVDQIISARGLRLGEEDSSRRHATWLLTEEIVEVEQMKHLLPLVTTGGDVYRAQVVGFFDGTGPTARAEVVVDGTVSPPRRVYWKDLRLLGRGYSPETLGAESPLAPTGGSLEPPDLMPLSPSD
ncbi:MAG: general secretion pathway protein GspK [Planctomycetes bacterium]|nr:general secretion pathway protein GspK [Planctomycetota bacterium]